jgi:hypothetical protein
LKLARSQVARRYPRDFTFYFADTISSIPALALQFPSHPLSIMHRKPVMMEGNQVRFS